MLLTDQAHTLPRIGWLSRLFRIGVTPADTVDERVQKKLQTVMALASIPLIAVQGAMVARAGAHVAAWFNVGYCLATASLIVLVALTGRYAWIRYGHLPVVILAPYLMHWYLGGFNGSGGVFMWSFMAAFAALMFIDRRGAAFVAGGIAALLVLSIQATAWPWPGGGPLPPEVRAQQLLLNSVGMILFAFLSVGYYSRRVDEERGRSEALLLNVLPPSIARRLKRGESPIADRVESATILFADLVGFTTLAARLAPEQVVAMLNEVFSELDTIADRHGLEKVKTIGDAYMAVAGLPLPAGDHALRVGRAALELRQAIQRIAATSGVELDMRVGVHSGPVVAGVIGRRKFAYDLWGDAVNVASRMESHGLPGRVQISAETAALLGDAFELEPRGEIEIKGKGTARTFWLVAERAAAAVRKDAPP